MNVLAGPASLTKVAAMKFDFDDPPLGYGRLYMEKSSLDDGSSPGAPKCDRRR